MPSELIVCDGGGRLAAWGRLGAGVLLVFLLVVLLMQGYTPPGPAGDVIRNNLASGIDATPLFYTELESLLPQE